MKSLKRTGLAVLCSLFFIASGFAGEDPKSINEQLKEKIVKLIDKPNLTHLDGWKFHAEVEFIVTRQNQILVLAVYTNNIYLDEYIKEKLNYHNIGIKGVQRLTPYRVNVNFVKP